MAIEMSAGADTVSRMPKSVASTFYQGDLRVLKAIFFLWILAYTLLVVISGTSVLCLLFIAGATLGSFYWLERISLKRGDDDLVQEILGSDLKTKNPDDKPSKDEWIMKVVGHRFCGLDAPENTLEALDACYKAGCTAVEFDVSMTRDKKLIIFHDDSVDRMTEDTGLISEKKYDVVAKYDVSVNHPFREKFIGSKIPTFEEALKKCLEYDMRIFIDIKDSNQEVINKICSMFEKHPKLYRRAVVSSFNPYIIYQIRQKKPSIVGSLAWRPYYFSYTSFTPEDPSKMAARSGNFVIFLLQRFYDIISTWLLFNITYRIVGVSCVLIHKDTITMDLINWWRERNVRCIAWTVNLPSEKIHFNKNFKITYLTDTMHAT